MVKKYIGNRSYKRGGKGSALLYSSAQSLSGTTGADEEGHTGLSNTDLSQRAGPIDYSPSASTASVFKCDRLRKKRNGARRKCGRFRLRGKKRLEHSSCTYSSEPQKRNGGAAGEVTRCKEE